VSAAATTAALDVRTITGATVSDIERAADAIAAIRIAWPWGEVWRRMGGQWVSVL
jgi:hypothetical protein